MDEGVLYYATGEQCFEEAKVSAGSVKRHMPELPITVVTDQGVNTALFETVIEIEPTDCHPFLDRIQYHAQSPYDRTLYLDTDTYVCGDLSDLFELLNRFDVAAGHSPVRHRTVFEDVPRSFAEFNCGVILYRDTGAVLDMFSRFQNIYTALLEEHGHIIDEPAFCKAVYESDLDVYAFTDEYNCKFFGPTFMQGEVKIIHGRHDDMSAMAEIVNKETGKRVLTGHSDRRMFAEPKPMSVYNYPGPRKWQVYMDRVKRSTNERGWRETLKLIRERAKRLF